MSSRLLVLSELGSTHSDLAPAIARSQRAKLMRFDPEPPPIEPWQWALASVMVDVERAFAQDLAWLVSMAKVGRRLASGHDVLWSLDAVGPRVASLALSVPALVDRLDPEHRVAAQAWLDEVEPVRRRLADGSVGWLAVVHPEPGARRQVRRWRDHLGVVGARPGALVVAGVPARRDPWPTGWARDRRRRAERLIRLGQRWSVDALALPLSPGTPAGSDRARRSLRGLRVAPGSLGADVGPRIGEEVTWPVPIRIPRDARDLRVGRVDDALIVRVCDLSRLIALPPLVSRCTLVGAHVHGTGLTVRAVPDERVWRST